eukprot:scaffold108165_cov45-Phaeocystis_antarctica.AAC.1
MRLKNITTCFSHLKNPATSWEADWREDLEHAPDVPSLQTRCSSDPRRQSLAEVESSVKPRCRRTQGQRLEQKRVGRRRRAPASRSGRRPQHWVVAREQPLFEQVVQQLPQLHRALAQR